MAKVIVGTSALPEAEVDRMKDAIIGWLRHGLPYLFVDRQGGEPNRRYVQAREMAVRRSALAPPAS